MADKTFEAATRTLSSLIVTGRAGQKSDTPQQVPVFPYWRTESAMRRDQNPLWQAAARLGGYPLEMPLS